MSIINLIWKEGKEILAPFAKPVAKRLIAPLRRKFLLHSFSKEFSSHPSIVSDIVDYYKWHHSTEDWEKGSGVLLSATYKELDVLWSSDTITAEYEAQLLCFIKMGGKAKRLFIYGSELFIPSNAINFCHVVYRHHILGLNPRISTVTSLRAAGKALEVNCEMFSVLNDKISHYYKFPKNDEPLMMITTEKKFVQLAINNFNELWKNSQSFESWMKKQVFELDEEEKKRIEHECVVVHGLAH